MSIVNEVALKPRQQFYHMLETEKQQGRPLVIAAPLAELSHPAIRKIWNDLAPPHIAYSEMISASAYLQGGPYETSYVQDEELDYPLVYQIAGADPVQMAEAVAKVAERGAWGVDINMGCSAPAMVRKGWGAAWLGQVERGAQLLEELRKLVPNLFLGVKTRFPKDGGDGTMEDILQRWSSTGVDLVAIHGRSVGDPYGRPARWDRIARVSAALPCPVAANGDIADKTTMETRLQRFTSLCSLQHSALRQVPEALLVGRAAFVTPWVFGLLAPDRLRVQNIRWSQLISLFTQEIRRLLHPHFWESRARLFFTYVIKNFSFGHGLIGKLRPKTPLETMEAALLDYLQRHPEEDQLELT